MNRSIKKPKLIHHSLNIINSLLLKLFKCFLTVYCFLCIFLGQEFAGNTDSNTIAYHELKSPIRARYIRFRPTAWNGHITMRVELYGCTGVVIA